MNTCDNMWDRKVFIRIIELLLCISCVVALRVTDDESRRVFHYLRNRSREWSLLNNVTWGTIGAALATATCGGYVIVTTGLLVAAATGELRGRKTELFFLGLGVILFGIVGALSLASIDSVPEDLVDNAAVLGALCLLTALVFVIDILMRIPGAKKKHDSTQTGVEKDIVKLPLAKLGAEKETKSSGNAKGETPPLEVKGSVNEGFNRSEPSAERDLNEGDAEEGSEEEVTRSQRRGSRDLFESERNRKFEDVGKQLREYALQGFDAGRESRRRGVEGRNGARREYFGYENGDISGFPREATDETDTPPFPTSFEGEAPIFARIVNPGVKIMRVERETGGGGNPEDYRNSDTSQYDNVPTRMRSMSPSGILKRNRDVSFTVPAAPKMHYGRNGSPARKDDIQRLEECFSAIQNSIGTQTAGLRDLEIPSSPNDPGYVRHTASNWPRDLKSKTPGSSPEHEKK
ncbi:uncharacterized protein LOC124298116 isoform X1 [Neodiprion virginianus]|uniref:uncharacterized protein LOC124298116 isoform X1 n=1 Tax=Neodiprion virginianus TaxID=2961670 RepID=UPI001EE6FBBD|nr:uncharacterized protein LOC124298116 isoform X1 [Neodiprion virginianus]